MLDRGLCSFSMASFLCHELERLFEFAGNSKVLPATHMCLSEAPVLFVLPLFGFGLFLVSPYREPGLSCVNTVCQTVEWTVRVGHYGGPG